MTIGQSDNEYDGKCGIKKDDITEVEDRWSGSG